MRVLGVDIATNSGFAVDLISGGEKPLTGTFRAEHFGDELGRAFVVFERWLEDMIRVHRPEVLAFEAPLVFGGRDGSTRHTTHQTIRKLFGLASIAELVGYRAELQVFECHIQSVRKHFVGSGRADKREVLHRCRVLGWPVADDNAADAAAVWSFAKSALQSNAAKAGGRA
jgi:Holliday junction resolvasome RuvABC endonuclease subunit